VLFRSPLAPSGSAPAAAGRLAALGRRPSVGALGLALLCTGRIDEATRVLDALLEAGPSSSAIPYVNRALLNWFVGRWDRALADQRAAQALHPGSLPAYAAFSATLAGLIEVASGRETAGERLLEQGGRFYAQSDFYFAGVFHDWCFGSARALAGQPVVGEQRLARAAERAAAMDVPAIESFVLPDLAQTRADLGNVTGAGAAAERAEAIAVRLGTTFASALASYAAGVAAHASGRAAQARTALQTAADLASSSGLRVLEARARHRLARALEGSDRVRAMAESGRLFDAIGARREQEATVSELRGLGAAGRRSAHEVGDLTPREREVVALARTGLQNRDIAERLGVSERTVETHLAHAYSKLGVEGRRELMES